MKNYSFKFEIGDLIVPITVKAFTERSAYKKAYRKALKFLG
jgi:hypothetical protein